MTGKHHKSMQDKRCLGMIHMHNFKLNHLTVSLMLAGMSFNVLSAADVNDETKKNTTSISQMAVVSDSNIDSEANVDTQASANAESEIEVINITGFRRSMIESLDVKRYSDTIVDVVTSDDLGALPDLSIADALTRLPGVTAVRTGGQSSELNIRGLSGNYVFATMNGREQVSSSGGRSVEFSQFPSELISSAMVYKSQKASLIEGGVAGTIELGTANPLNMKKDQQFHINAQLTGNSRSDEHPDAASTGHRISFSYQAKFLDETLGVSLGVASLFAPTVSNQFLSYPFIYDRVRLDGIGGLDDCLAEGENTSPSYENVDCVAYNSGFEMMTRGGEDTRNGVMSSIVWQPSDSFTLKADVFYSKFDSKTWDKGLVVNGLSSISSTDHLNSVDLLNPVVVGDDDSGYSIIGGEYHNAYYSPFATYEPGTCNELTPGKVVVPCVRDNRFFGVNPLNIRTSADNSSHFSDTFTAGLNATWHFDALSVSVDVSHSKASEEFIDQEMSLMLFDDAHAATPKVETDLVLSYQMDGLKVPQLSITNEAGESVDFTDLDKMMVVNNTKFPWYEENQADALKIDFDYRLESDFFRSVEAGIRVSKRKHTNLRSMWSYGGPGHFENGQHLNYRTENDMRLGSYIEYVNGVEVARFQPYALSSGEVEVVQLGGEFSSLPSFLSIDTDDISSKWALDADGNPLATDGVDIWEGAAWTIGADRHIQEDVKAAYLLLNLDLELAGHPITGNVGVRFINTKQTAKGITAAPTSRRTKLDENGQPVLDRFGDIVLEVVGTGDEISDDLGFSNTDNLYRTLEHSYTNVLPSLNLTFGITENQYLKFAAAKVMARPVMADMAVSGNFSYQYDRPRDGKDVVNMDISTSPFIEPFLATQFDVSYEYYFSESAGNIFVALFNKDIESFKETIIIENYNFAANNISIPEFSDNGRPVEPGDVSMTVNNDKGGYIRGAEIGYTQVFSMLPGAWSGLGFTGSFSYTQSEITRDLDIGNGRGDVNVPLEGLSPRVYATTLFYDYKKFDTRISARYRSKYLGSVSGSSSNKAFVTDEMIIDYQASYDITDNLNILISVNNLTDEASRSYYGDQSKTGNIQYFGRNYFMGVDYTF